MAGIRAYLYAAYFYAVTLIWGLAGLVLRRAPGRVALGFAQSWVAALLAGLRPLAGVRVSVTGLAHLPADGPALLACQHQSEFDTLVWMRLLRRPAYVMKMELLETPLVGPMLVPAGMIPVDRAGGAAALRRLLQDAESALADGRQIVVFPEGTRVPPGARVPLQPGIAALAARLNLPVVPVATDSGRCWGRQRHRLQPGVIHIAVGPPIPPRLPRAALLSAIEGFWRHAEACRFTRVDNSVGETPQNLHEHAATGR
jgi:1-acyl-sn-glycerol-3-phosphate acyltransferase